MPRLALVLSLLLAMACKTSAGESPRPPEDAPPPAPAEVATAESVATPAATEPQDFASAERAYHDALIQDARSRGAFEGLARPYYERGIAGSRGYLDLAERVIAQGERVLAESGQRSAALAWTQALVWLSRGRQDLAKEALRRALEIEPGHVLAALNLARLEIQWGEPAAALGHLAIAGRDPSIEFEVRLSEGVAHYALRDRRAAEEALRRAQALAPEEPRPAYNLGLVMLLDLESMDEAGSQKYERIAIEHFNRFLALADAHPELAGRALEARDQIVALEERSWTGCRYPSLDIDRKVREMQELQIKQEAAERERLLELERQATASEEAAAREAGTGTSAIPDPPAGGR